MSDYTNSFGGAAKDAANSTILAADHDTEYDGIATMSATKANKVGSPTVDNLVTMTATGDMKDSGSTIAAVQQVTYPVGAIFLATVATDPNTLLGFGTWTQISQGRMLIGEGSGAGLTTRTAGAEIGAEDAVNIAHTHTITDPGHSENHTYATGASSTGSGAATGGASGTAQTGGTGLTNITIDSAGVAGTDLNIPPALVVYMWERTA